MTKPGVLDTHAINLLARVLDKYSARNGVGDPSARDSAAASLLHLYGRGITDEDDLLRLLELTRLN